MTKKPDEDASQKAIIDELLKRGRAHREDGDYRAAESDYREALKLDPENPQAHNQLGITFSRQQKRSEAIAEFRTALRFAPKNAAIHGLLAAALVDSGKNNEAIEECHRILAYQPEFAYAFCLLGRSYRALQQRDAAHQASKEFLRLMPTEPGGYYEFGSACALIGDFDAAIRNLYKARELGRRGARLWICTMLAYWDNGQYGRALKLLFGRW